MFDCCLFADPLRRTFVANIRASLGDLCLRKAKGTWAPSPEALRSMLQQKKVRRRNFSNKPKSNTHILLLPHLSAIVRSSPTSPAPRR
jgi:hypothetical protein